MCRCRSGEDDLEMRAWCTTQEHSSGAASASSVATAVWVLTFEKKMFRLGVIKVPSLS